MSDFYRFSATGLTVTRELSEADYDVVGRRIRAIASGVNWAVGDWLVYGEARAFWRAKYAEAQELTGIDYNVLSNTLRVAKGYQPSQRIASLSWTHHHRALSLPATERMDVLLKCEREGWTSSMLAAYVTTRNGQPDAPIEAIEEPQRTKFSHIKRPRGAWTVNGPRREWRKKKALTCPHCGHVWSERVSQHPGAPVEAPDQAVA